jgi:hypothetical protein
MISCLGAYQDSTIIIECKYEFTKEEIDEFLVKSYEEGELHDITFPEWLPRRPLVIQIVLKYARELLFCGSEAVDFSPFARLWWALLHILLPGPGAGRWP